jgi:hypothetical protein
MHQRAIRWQRLFAFALAATLLLASPAAIAGKGKPDKDVPGVIPPHANAFGKTYEEWSTVWWQWAHSLPAPVDDQGHFHPLFDETGEDCDVGQQGHVWFLGGVFNVSGTANRALCTIPTGTALFFPFLNFEMDNVGIDDPFTRPELENICEHGSVDLLIPGMDDPDLLEVSLDGTLLKNPESYRIDPTFFSYTVPPDNSLYDAFGSDFEGEVLDAVSCGYYVMLSPLSKGKHTLHFKATIHGGSFALDITYTLNVVPAGQYKALEAPADQAPADAAATSGGKEKANHKHKSRNGGQHRSKGKHRH